MKTPHTPGPWVTRKSELSRPESKRVDIVTTTGDFSPSFVAGDALPEDARLIASAPELLSALVALLEQADLGEVDEETAPIVEAARAAIAKATEGK